MHDDALPVGGEDDALDREKLLNGSERRQQRPAGLVEHEQAVQGHAVARVVHHQKSYLQQRGKRGHKRACFVVSGGGGGGGEGGSAHYLSFIFHFIAYTMNFVLQVVYLRDISHNGRW